MSDPAESTVTVRPSSCAHQLRHLAVICGEVVLPPEKLSATLTQIADLVQENEEQLLLCRRLLMTIRQMAMLTGAYMPAATAEVAHAPSAEVRAG